MEPRSEEDIKTEVSVTFLSKQMDDLHKRLVRIEVLVWGASGALTLLKVMQGCH